MFEMSTRGKDAIVLLLVGAGIIALALLLLFSLPLVIEAMLIVIAVILFVVAVAVVVGTVSAIPYYFIKRGPKSEPAHGYRLEEIKAVKEDEGK